MISKALFSIHDVMPETLLEVSELLDRFRDQGAPLPALLVVPGQHWAQSDLNVLASWVAEGAELVAHGWDHYSEPRSLYHRLHSAILSRNAAEHLAYDADGVVALMNRSYRWFSAQGLPAPRTYVPPAWALGIRQEHLLRTTFNTIETLAGVYVRGKSTFTPIKLPLIGFEADSKLRASFLRHWNEWQMRIAKRHNAPLRVAIHPNDGQLLLSQNLQETIELQWQHLHYSSLQQSS